MEINYTKIKNTDLSHLIPLTKRHGFKKIINNPAGEEHYKLLAYITHTLTNAKILELGTHNGTSSTVLSDNPTNKVRTYDVEDLYNNNHNGVYNNIIRIVGNMGTKDNPYKGDIFDLNEQHYMLEADFIFLDTAHLGGFEWKVYEYLRDNNYKNFIVFDDIHLELAMQEFWSKIPNNIKYDITEIGHGLGIDSRGNPRSSGTGLVDFSGRVTIVK
tara:strand:- start:183 stop:827 length:645 start_codon:yes stop_codon:yes gene_type:complete